MTKKIDSVRAIAALTLLISSATYADKFNLQELNSEKSEAEIEKVYIEDALESEATEFSYLIGDPDNCDEMLQRRISACERTQGSWAAHKRCLISAISRYLVCLGLNAI